jgi:predicted enzyme related to lactoylglutathione lyase
LRVDLVVNPATDIVFAVDDLLTPRARLRDENAGTGVSTTKSQLGESLPFFDDDGNLFSMAQLAESATTSASGFVGVKLGALLKNRQAEESRMTAVHLMVSDVAKSGGFYEEVVGLERLQGLEGVTTFDLRTSILNLLPESTPRMVQALGKSGRLTGDWFVFHTKDVGNEMKRLERRGVNFPYGIEESAVGRMAYFNDPNGYSLVLWQPPADETLPMKKINFFPTLNRILREAA